MRRLGGGHYQTNVACVFAHFSRGLQPGATRSVHLYAASPAEPGGRLTEVLGPGGSLARRAAD
eukprot:2059404-Pyramimonas_sp.AAC.1